MEGPAEVPVGGVEQAHVKDGRFGPWTEPRRLAAERRPGRLAGPSDGSLSPRETDSPRWHEVVTRLAQVSPGRGGTWGRTSRARSSRARTGSATGRRSSGAWTSSPGCSPSPGSTPSGAAWASRSSSTSPTRSGDPAMANEKVLAPDGRPRLPDRAGPVQHRDQHPAERCSTALVFSELEAAVRASLNHADDVANEAGTDVVMIGILPTVRPEHLTEDTFSANPRYKLLNEQVFAARGEDIHLAIDGVERISTYADTHRARGGLHQRPAAPAGQPRDLRRALERLPGHRRRAARAGRELAVLLRQGALARDADRPLRAGCRHPLRRAQGAGRAAACVVRRALDHLDLRPVRGERPLLPVLLPIVDDEDPLEVLRARRRAAARRAAAAQRHHLPLEPPGLRRRPRAAAPAGREPLPARRPDRRRRPRQRRVLLRAGQGAGRAATGRCGRRCRSPRRRRTSTTAPSTASTRASTGRASARCRRPSWCCGACCRWPTAGWRSGASRGRQGPAARHHRAALPARRERRAAGRRPTFHRLLRRRTTGPTRCAR